MRADGKRVLIEWAERRTEQTGSGAGTLPVEVHGVTTDEPSPPSPTPLRPLWDDTAPEAEAFLLERYRRMAPWEKLRMVSQLSIACQQVHLAGLRQRFPGASERELELRLAAARLGPELVREAFGWAPGAP